MSLTKLGLGIYLPVWGSDLPFRQHAQASRPVFLEGRCMPAGSLFFSQEPIRIPIAPRPRARLPRDRQLKNQWASDHCHTMAGGTPILALDMCEHSHHIDYGAEAAGLVDVFMAAINWPAVQRAYHGLQK